jgi:hypothetical protein
MDYKISACDPHHPMDATLKVFNVIISEAGLKGIQLHQMGRKILPLCQALALAVGHKKRTGEVKIAPKEMIDRVEEVLGENSEPSRYEMC